MTESPRPAANDPSGRHSDAGPAVDRAQVEEANAGFYAAFEHGDFDAMQAVWADDDGIVCVHPASAPIRGRFAVMRSWMALIAADSYIQFFLTDVEISVEGDIAAVTCTENVLAAAPGTPTSAFTGGSATATNVFRRTEEGWRLWIHHASPVLSAGSDMLDPDDESGGGIG